MLLECGLESKAVNNLFKWKAGEGSGRQSAWPGSLAPFLVRFVIFQEAFRGISKDLAATALSSLSGVKNIPALVAVVSRACRQEQCMGAGD